ncbi:MAG: hypothetical protein CMH47_12360 [Muricauda sp.]|nr:hypothetical protein [Allomuricauda sp.]|tara:strand:+ start:6699 stop:6896 length:198 start_codon:yes stop_codon:yes gene_type:complete
MENKNTQGNNRNYKGNNEKGFDGKTGFLIRKRILDDYPDCSTENISRRFNWLKSEIERIFEKHNL